MTDGNEQAILALLESQIKERNSQHEELKTIVTDTREAVVELSHRMDLHEQNDHHVHTMTNSRITAHDDRLEGLETSAEATGRHELVTVKKSIDTWMERGWKVFAALAVLAFVALVTSYLSTR